MQIVIAPAKQMQAVGQLPLALTEPCLLSQAAQVLAVMQGKSSAELQKLYRCSAELAVLNHERWQRMDFKTDLTPALLAYQGLQYRCLAPRQLNNEQLAYLQEHLLILSAFYGLLRPSDGVRPYRLELRSPLAVGDCHNLYAFWADAVNTALGAPGTPILNLASREYAQVLDRRRFVVTDVVFAEIRKGRLTTLGTHAKMARGLLLRYLTVQRAAGMEALREFTGAGYRLDERFTKEHCLVFTRDPHCDHPGSQQADGIRT